MERDRGLWMRAPAGKTYITACLVYPSNQVSNHMHILFTLHVSPNHLAVRRCRRSRTLSLLWMASSCHLHLALPYGLRRGRIFSSAVEPPLLQCRLESFSLDLPLLHLLLVCTTVCSVRAIRPCCVTESNRRNRCSHRTLC